jgi:hypothetical protein
LLRTENSVELIEKYRHNIARLVKDAETLGLFVTTADRDVFALMADTNVLIEMRYIRTGVKTASQSQSTIPYLQEHAGQRW